MFTRLLSRRILAAAALLFAASCSREERSKVELTPHDVVVIADRALQGVLPGMSPEEVRKRLQRYCLVQESTNPRGGDLLLVFENITPCEPDLNARLRALAQTTVSEACLQGTAVPPEQHRVPASRDGISIVFDHGVAVSAPTTCNLQPDVAGQSAQALLAQLLGRNLDIYWAAESRVGFLPEPIFALVDNRKIYLRYTVFGDSAGKDEVFLTLSTRATR
jgi:hypothetical protein